MSDKDDNKILSELIAAAQGGEESARAKLVEITQVRLFRFCVYLCHDLQQAEDLSQDTLIKVLKNIGRLNKSLSYFDWVFQIAKNTYIDSIRNRQNQMAKAGAQSGEELLLSLSMAESERETVYAVRKLLSQFEPNEKLQLILVDIEGLSYLEASKVLGVTESALKSSLYRIRQEFMARWKKLETK